MKRPAHLLLSASLTVALGAAANTAQAAPPVIQVGTTSNADTTTDHVCTLVEAVKAINNNATYHECTGGSAYNTIQLPSGTINSGSITMNRAVTIRGNGLTSSTINFTSSSTGCGVRAVANVNLTNLTLQQATGLTMAGVCGGGGRIFLTGMRVRSFQNGGVSMISGSVAGNDVRIENNRSLGGGGGIFIGTGAQMGVIERCSITGNVATTNGGGLAMFGGGAGPMLMNCTIANNQAQLGGAAYIHPLEYMQFNFCTIVLNTASSGGGIYSDPNGTFAVRMYDNIFVSNEATNLGQGAQFYGPTDFPGQAGTGAYNLWGGPFDEFMNGISDGEGDATLIQATIGTESTGASNTGAPFSMVMYPLRSTSTAVNRDTRGCTGITDMRGVARPRGTGCDLGSYER